MIVGL